MTDLEATRLCALAMDLLRDVVQDGKVHPVRFGSSTAPVHHYETHDFKLYDPLHDGGQAMALVKRFNLDVSHCEPSGWIVFSGLGDGIEHQAEDLNRAIVLTVAAMQAAKGAG